MAPMTKPDSAVLLDAGTNEVEILVFQVAETLCGVNVAKVREVRTHQSTTALPRAQAGVDGVVHIRDAVVPLVDLHQVLWGTRNDHPTGEPDELLVLEFNDQMAAFRVQSVDRIYRISWKNFMPLPHCPGLNAPVTGIILLNGRIVTVLDFEAIGGVLGINGTLEIPGAETASPAASHGARRPPLVYADDSPLIRRMLDGALSGAGYSDRHGFADGQEAWDYLEGLALTHDGDAIGATVGAVISDIEMPRMDGFTLTRRIREHPVLRGLPVVLFSSLISKDNEKKGLQVGATAQVSKPRWEELSSTLIDVLRDVAAGCPCEIGAGA